jgi:crotonobetainyl-CoA:carnitine CoA-transferase CaiB-like acyl-CoA transferase
MSGQAPLAGVRVVDMTQVVVGPYATAIMADHGADVIKIETAGGDLARTIGGKGRSPGMGPKFLHLNRNKRSMQLDLKQPAGMEAMHRLLKTADVLIYNVRPPAMARLGLAYEDVCRIRPDIVYCGMYGFGQDGRYRAKPAYDSIIQGSTGFAALYHRATGTPRYLPMVIADRTAGLMALNMVMLALFHRARTGEGQKIDVPMFENMAALVLAEHMYLKTFVPPIGQAGDPRLLDPESRPLETKDGFVCITANTNAQAFGLFDAMGRPDMKTDPRFSTTLARFENVREYYAIRAEAMKRRTTAEWIEILDKADVPCMPYHTLDSLMEDPHLADVGLIEEIDHPTEGRIKSLRVANRLSRFTPSLERHAPHLGEQSVAMLGELGFSKAEIDAMIASGATNDGRPKQST